MSDAQIVATVVDPELARQQEQRRDWALILLTGGAIVMTIFAAISLYLVSAEVKYSFWLGIAAHFQVAIVLTGLMGLLVKRALKISKGGISVIDYDTEGRLPSEDDLLSRKDVKKEVKSAIEETPVAVPGKVKNEHISKQS